MRLIRTVGIVRSRYVDRLIVLLSFAPYAQPIVARLLGNWILLAPLLATVLAGFAWLVMRNELRLFERIATAYWRQQNKLLDDDLKHDLDARRPFGVFVQSYLILLTCLSLANGGIMSRVWIPALAMAAPNLLR